MSPLTEEPSSMSLAPSSTTSGEFCPGPTTPSEVLAPSAMSAAAEDPEKVLSTTDQPVTEDAEDVPASTQEAAPLMNLLPLTITPSVSKTATP